MNAKLSGWIIRVAHSLWICLALAALLFFFCYEVSGSWCVAMLYTPLPYESLFTLFWTVLWVLYCRQFGFFTRSAIHYGMMVVLLLSWAYTLDGIRQFIGE